MQKEPWERFFELLYTERWKKVKGFPKVRIFQNLSVIYMWTAERETHQLIRYISRKFLGDKRFISSLHAYCYPEYFLESKPLIHFFSYIFTDRDGDSTYNTYCSLYFISLYYHTVDVGNSIFSGFLQGGWIIKTYRNSSSYRVIDNFMQLFI